MILRLNNQSNDRYIILRLGLLKIFVLLMCFTCASPIRLKRTQGYDCSSGVWQFEGYGYVSCGTTGVCIMQVFGASSHATTLMLRVYDGSLYYYREKLLVPSICDRWFRLRNGTKGHKPIERGPVALIL